MSVLTPINEAFSKLLLTIESVDESELVPALDCVGRVLVLSSGLFLNA